MLFEPDTVMPLSPGIPGVSIESEPVASNYTFTRYNIAAQKLSLSDEMYNYLRVTHVLCTFPPTGFAFCTQMALYQLSNAVATVLYVCYVVCDTRVL